jgi:hypothetical protein
MNKCRLATGLILWTGFIATGQGQTLVDLRTQSKSVDFSAAGPTKPMQTGSNLPSTCAVGQFFFLTTAAAGSNVYACNPINAWTLEGSSLSVNSSSTNEVLSSNGSSIQWLALGGDISGAPGGLTVNRLQGRNVSNAAPSSGQVLQWNAATSQWQPAPADAGNSSYAFTTQVSITIPGAVHQFGTANLVVECYDNSTPPQQVEPDKIQISPATYNVTINFSTAQTGYCVVNGAGTAAMGGTGGAVGSVFGRGGAVAAQNGDYSFGQISGAVASGQLPGAGGDLSGTLTAATVKAIQGQPVSSTQPSNGQALLWNSAAAAWQPGTVSGSGAVSSVFGRTAAILAQTGDYSFGQISGAVASGQLPGAGGDLSGTLTAATVKAIQGQPVSSTQPSNGQALLWNSAAAAWQPANVSGSGSGVTMAYQLGDLAAVRTSSAVLSIGAGCASTSPCNARFGYQVYSITNSATATVSGTGIGTAYVYLNNSGTLMVGHNLTVACSAGCTQQAGITSFPPNVLPVYTWTATNGVWDTTGGRDQRAFLSAKTLAGGPGIVVTEAPGQSTLAVDNGVIPTYLMNSATLTFASIGTGACATDQSIAVAGANPGDAVAPGWPPLPAGVSGIMLVGGANTVTVRLCNMSASAVTPPSASYRATIVRNY